MPHKAPPALFQYTNCWTIPPSGQCNSNGWSWCRATVDKGCRMLAFHCIWALYQNPIILHALILSRFSHYNTILWTIFLLLYSFHLIIFQLLLYFPHGLFLHLFLLFLPVTLLPPNKPYLKNPKQFLLTILPFLMLCANYLEPLGFWARKLLTA